MSADKYFNLNLKDADYVFNAKETNPAIQFQYQINYGFVKRDREKEKEEKERRDEEKNDERNKEKSFYILGKDGELKKVDMKK